MTDQGSLFTINYNQEPTPQPNQPTCPSCRLAPARWNRKRNEYYRYCGISHCVNYHRKCNVCDNPYDKGAPGAGSKYCSEKCKQLGYTAGFNKRNRKPLRCRFCDEPTGSQTAVCPPCIRDTPWAGALGRHHAPEWLWEHMTTNGTCMNPGCGKDLRGTWKRGDTGAYITTMHVDHDHTCCARSTSCGRCVRGVLCQHCNQALGLLHNNLATITGLGTYLDMASVKT